MTVGTLIDVRLARAPVYYLAPQKGLNLRVPTTVTNCVVTIGVPDDEAEGGIRFGGTAFVVTLKGERIGNFHFLITAKHCLKEIGNRPYLIRANTTTGDSVLFAGHGLKWYTHPDETVDAAVAIYFPPREIPPLTLRSIPVENFLTDEDVANHGIGAGDEVFMTGLFTEVQGRSRNIPIVRMGAIAAIPDEPVPFGESYTDAYLVESRSIGGLSGSPAFVSETIEIPYTRKHTTNARYWAPGKTFFLGVVRGHWQVPPMRSLGEAEKVNMGIAIVVPAKKIREIIDLPELANMRKEAEKTLLSKKTERESLDSGFDKPFTKEDFEASLKKASRKIAPPKK